MSPLLLILVLFSDPSGEDSAKIISEELARLGGNQVQVEVGPEAIKQLDKLGMKLQDLVVSPNLANHLTASEKNLIIIRLDHRIVGGDQIMESKVWTNGRSDNHVSIAGKGGDPLSGAISGIIQVIGPRLPTQPDIKPSLEDTELASLAEAKEWKALVARLTEVPMKDPRQLYYLILGQSKMGQPDQARENYVHMRTNYPGHFLTRAAEVLVPASAKPIENLIDQVTPLDDGSNVLRDAPPAKDDGSNVLR